MSSFRLQYTSNLFVDLHKRTFDQMVKPGCAQLALLGNIGRPEHGKTYHFLKYCSKNWDNVYWIPGPHELTNTPSGRANFNEKISNAFSLSRMFPNVMLMDNKEAVFHKQRVVLVGSPLWSHLRLPPRGQPEFSTIFTSVDEGGPIPLCHHIRNQLHKQDNQFLIERSFFWTIVHPDVNIIHLTHTLPSPRLLRPPISEEAMNRLPMDIVHRTIEPPLKAWIGGATGCTQKAKMGTDPDTQVTVAVNSMFEYPFQNKVKDEYEQTAILELHATPPTKSTGPPSLPRLILPPLLSSLLQPKPFLQHA